jgi:phosphate transport system protein
MATHLQREIKQLKKSILGLGALVEDSLRRALTAIERDDETLAADAIDRDFEIDLKEVEIEEECLKALALYQPVAGDLRFIIATIKINTTLERIGDLAVNIGERALMLSGQERPAVPFDMPRFADKAQRMVSHSLDALVRADTELARVVLAADDEIDNMDTEYTTKLKAVLAEHPEAADPIVHLLQLSRFVERIADHATSIAEDVIYMVEGEIPRHSLKRAVAEAMTINEGAVDQ